MAVLIKTMHHSYYEEIGSEYNSVLFYKKISYIPKGRILKNSWANKGRPEKMGGGRVEGGEREK